MKSLPFHLVTPGKGKRVDYSAICANVVSSESANLFVFVVFYNVIGLHILTSQSSSFEQRRFSKHYLKKNSRNSIQILFSAQIYPFFSYYILQQIMIPNILPLFLSIFSSNWHLLSSRGTPINLYDQPGNWHRGPGDIANLWVGFMGEGFRPGGPVTRNAIKPNSQNRWTRYQNDRGQFIIPYIISGKFDSQEHATIARAMLAIAENTCIKFEKRGGEADYVDLKNERGEGCYTVVGRSPGKNTVMLETNEIATCLEFDIVIHELMHTIGLWHEQMRYDRDEFIKIHWENIGPAYVNQFEKVPDTDSTTYNVKYDYQSVMHYAKDAFASAPGKITMETLDKQFQDLIGKVRDASPSDYLKICNIYSCHTCMGHPFSPGQSQPGNGQKVITLGPGVITLPTASPSPATLPLWSPTQMPTQTPTLPKGNPTPSSPPPIAAISSTQSGPAKDSKEKEDRRMRPTPILPIILPLINNNWWWKNTPAPPLRDPHGRMLLRDDDGQMGKGENGTKIEEREAEKLAEKMPNLEEKEEKNAEWREMPEIQEEKSKLVSSEWEKVEKNEKENGNEKKKNEKKKEDIKKEKLLEKVKQKIEEEEKRMEEILTFTTTKMPENEEEKNKEESLILRHRLKKQNCRGDAAFCARIFTQQNGERNGGRELAIQSAIKACALEVISRNCCRSCWVEEEENGNGNEEDDDEKKIGAKRRKMKKAKKGRKINRKELMRRKMEEKQDEESTRQK